MIYFLIFSVLIIYLFIVFKRAKRYKYNTSKDYLYDLDKNLISKLKMKNNILNLPSDYKDYDSLFLKINLSFSPISYFLKPYIQIEDTKHFFEYGARGVRYLNISHTTDIPIKLSLNNLSLSNEKHSIYGYKNKIDLSKKILILAPHADDAEIAAFGLYKTAKDVTIVTTTAGEQGVCNYCDLYNNNKTIQARKKAELRALDAISIPQLGHVKMENSLALGYFGGTLRWMSENRSTEATSNIDGINNMNLFRRVSHSNIKLNPIVEPTYSSFINDLEDVLEQVKPDIIITPHPTIDSHPDHKQTTLSLLEAIKNRDASSKLLLYTNHLKLSETYPVGEIHSLISLPPNTKEFYYDSLYSFELDTSLQVDKFFALEAMHDLRDSLVSLSIKRSLKQLNKLIKRKLTGKDKSYYKRAIKTNELFFIVESKNCNIFLNNK
ncbi:MAG: PIG-L family deacetylase [Sulfurimonas sp.]|nr:PIG-L family deacetylase [Sulfurimonas sp.]